MEESEYDRQFSVQKIISCSQENTEWKKSSPLKTYSKKCTTPNSDKTDGKSRYGRSHKPRLSGDFLSTDKKVSQYLKINVDNQMHYFKASPYTVQKTPVKPITPGTPRGRGRPPKASSALPVVDSSYNALSEAFDRAIASTSSNDLQAPPPTSTETIDVPDMLICNREEPQSDSEEVINENDWNVGDLAWACVGGYPYWPCAVTKEPEQNIYLKMKVLGKNKQQKEFIHVRFFGDKGRRSWIASSNIIPFHGLDSFQSLAEETCSTPSIKKRDPKQFRAFTIIPSIRKTWQAAVSEAESLREAPRNERTLYFNNLFPPTPPQSVVVPEEKPLPKKRGRKSKAELAAIAATALTSPQMDLKKIKIEPVTPPKSHASYRTPTKSRVSRHTEFFIKKETLTPDRRCRTPSPTSLTSPLKIKIKEEPVSSPTFQTPSKQSFPIGTATPSSSGLSTDSQKKKRGRPLGSKNKKSSQEDVDFVPVKRKYEKKLPITSRKTNENKDKKKKSSEKKFRDPAFELFYDKNFDRVAAENPHLSDEDVEKFIDKMWREVRNQKPTGFRSRDNAENLSNDSGNDSKSEASSRSNSPPPIILPSSKAPYRRGLSLFSGIKSDKVCQVCLKHSEVGEILKCRGPCGLSFHFECSEKNRYEIHSESASEESNLVIKRKRGRPRSLPSQDTSLPDEIKSAPPVQTNLPTPMVSPDSTPSKRKRGRPPKNPVPIPFTNGNGCSTNIFVKQEPNLIDRDNVKSTILSENDSNGGFIGFPDIPEDTKEKISNFIRIYKSLSYKYQTKSSVSDTSLDLNSSSNDSGVKCSDSLSTLSNQKEKLDECRVDCSGNAVVEQNSSNDGNIPNSSIIVTDGETNEAINEEVHNYQSSSNKEFETIGSVDPGNENSILPLNEDNISSLQSTRNDNNKLLATLRGDSFESETSNNNLVVDESSTEDRLMIEESPVIDGECTETKSAILSIMDSQENSLNFDNMNSQPVETDLKESIKETDNIVRKISLDMPDLDFSETEDTMPPLLPPGSKSFPEHTVTGLNQVDHHLSSSSYFVNMMQENETPNNECNNHSIPENESSNNAFSGNLIQENESSNNMISDHSVLENKSSNNTPINHSIQENEVSNNMLNDHSVLENESSSNTLIDHTMQENESSNNTTCNDHSIQENESSNNPCNDHSIQEFPINQSHINLCNSDFIEIPELENVHASSKDELVAPADDKDMVKQVVDMFDNILASANNLEVNDTPLNSVNGLVSNDIQVKQEDCSAPPKAENNSEVGSSIFSSENSAAEPISIFIHEEDSNTCPEFKKEEKEVKMYRSQKSIDKTVIKNEVSDSAVIKDDDSSSKTSDSESDKAKNSDKWMCSICNSGKLGPCFVCTKDDDDGDKLKCAYCNKAYHEVCTQRWPQCQKSISAKGRVIFHCPQHVCHTCCSDNPGSISTRFAHDRLVRCVRCPATYHNGNYCIPAGSDILSISQILCPKHYKPQKKGTHHVSASWCMLCANGGSLICCDLCPNSFHLKCLQLDVAPQGSFYCEDCETGRFPLFGEIVWVKLGTYRWWPARILFPQEIPDNILQLPHSSGEFAVEFFGSHDYYWVNRGRCFLYHEGDGTNQNVTKSRTDELFFKGIEESKAAFLKWTEERASREANSRPTMKPPKYQKISSNRVVGNINRYIDSTDKCLAQTCECDPKKPNPCGPDSDCINRLLSVECDPEICPARDKCCNQNFEKRCYPRLVPFKTETRGWGLKTLDPIVKGSFIIEYVGEMIDEDEYQKRLAKMQKNKDENFYFLTIDKDRMLDAGPKGNVSRFMNHSCDPNCETQKWNVGGDTRVGLFALENIQPNTELVFNYNLETIGNNKVECKCGSASCSGFIGVKSNSKQNSKPKSNTSMDSKKNLVKKKRRKSKISMKHTEDSCFTCGHSGDLLLCDDANCPKAYHLSCLGLTKHPAGGWVCPWHQCSVCSATKVQRCTLCINSYCAAHAEGNISLNRTHGLLCFSHNPSDSGSDWSDDRGIPSDEEDTLNKKSQVKKYSKAKIVNGHVD